MARRSDLRPLVPAPSVALGSVLEFMRALWAFDHALGVRARALATSHGVTGAQRFVVRVVGQSPGISAGDVARVLHVHPSTLTAVLQQLVDRGVLERERDPVDRRRAVLWLTARGQRIDAAAKAQVDAVILAALERMAASEVFHARRVLYAIAEALGEAPAEARGRPRGAERDGVRGDQGTRQGGRRPKASGEDGARRQGTRRDAPGRSRRPQ
jgi:DNA-binding MarR family transcriptional regulator